VKLNDSPTGKKAGRFRTKQCSPVLLSANSQTTGLRIGLADVRRLCWYPGYSVRPHWRHSREVEHDSADLDAEFRAADHAVNATSGGQE
jgi:hypothetical protein